jgi:hypothetical protein
MRAKMFVRFCKETQFCHGTCRCETGMPRSNEQRAFSLGDLSNVNSVGVSSTIFRKSSMMKGQKP